MVLTLKSCIVLIGICPDNSVPESSPVLKSVIMDNGAPDKSDIIDDAHNSSLDTNLYSGTCQKSSNVCCRQFSFHF